MENTILQTVQNTTIEDKYFSITRIVGVMFLFNFLAPLLNWTLVFSKFVHPENALAASESVLAHPILFRIGILNELIIGTGSIVLAVSLYWLVKPTHPVLALIAMLLKTIESFIITVVALLNFIVLQFLTEPASASYGDQSAIITGLLINSHISLSALSMFFLGTANMLFFYMLFKNEMMPGILAAFGAISFGLILIFAMISVLGPEISENIWIQIICWLPSCLTEVVVGCRLIYKGVQWYSDRNVDYPDYPSKELHSIDMQVSKPSL